jgi:hypothetical protein
VEEEMTNGIFWFIDYEILSFPFNENENAGVSKSGVSYNHKKFWAILGGKITHNKPFDYYPRGRVEIDKRDVVHIWINPNLNSDNYILQIKRDFGITDDIMPKIHIDNSEHYKCYLDW